MASMNCTGTSGSAPIRPATSSSCSRRHRRALVLPGRARPGDGVPAAQGQARDALACRAPRSSSTAPPRSCWVRRGAACRRSSAWSTTRGSTACSARSRACRRGTLEAIHHARHRRAFGAGSSTSRRCRTCSPTWRSNRRPRPPRDAHRSRLRRWCRAAAHFGRFATAVMKYWICKRGARARGRGARVPRRQRLRRGLGDAGLYRGAPINSIWEGSGNVAALDVLRALAREARGGGRLPGRV